MGVIIYWHKYSFILWFLWNLIYSSRNIEKIKHKSITHNIFRIQDNESIMCGFYDIAFIEYVLSGKNLLDYTNLFPPNGYIYDKIVHKYFKDKYVKSWV